jgi:hypothetical protein
MPEKTSSLTRLARSASALFKRRDAELVAKVAGIDETLADPISMQFLLGTPNDPARSRMMIYEDWQFMLADPIIATAIELQVTAALGGHETSGDVVFIETKPDASDADKALVKELNEDLSGMFNDIAATVAFNGAAFGDAYARAYTEKGKGIVALLCSELIMPPLVQPFEQADQTIGFAVATGQRYIEKLTVKQMLRMKMPRKRWTPQQRVMEKAVRMALKEDDMAALPILPAMVGGSLLQNAETAYSRYLKALTGLVGMRVLDSIDETILGVQMEGTTKEQRDKFLQSFKDILKRSREYAEMMARSGNPVLTRIRHLIPIHQEKQVVNIIGSNGGASGGKQSTYTVDDVMFHARALAGALGTDLSMVGFADLLAGGLGEGGFFRTSAQTAERSRVIRKALAKFFDDGTALHLAEKSGIAFAPGKHPWVINYYGSISALEREKQSTRLDAMNTGSMLVQTLLQMKEMGGDEAAYEHILSREMKLDEDSAKMLAAMLVKAAKEAAKQNEGGFGGGPDDGGGGGFGGPGGPGGFGK